MSLPVPEEYLAKALENECCVGDVTLTLRSVGDLVLPTGQLVACDPFTASEAEPFSLELPRGTFPVILSLAQLKSDQRVAFATVRVRRTMPVVWDMMTVGSQDTAKLKVGEFFGYPVDAGTGSFLDLATSRLLDKRMSEPDAFYETMLAEMEKTSRDTWSWLDMKFGDGNLIAFSSGYGDGHYATYVGFDADASVAAVVTDFQVVPFEKVAGS